MKTHHWVLTNPNAACRLLTVFSLTGWSSPMQGPSRSCTIWSLAPFKLPLMSLVLSCLLQSHWPPFDSLKHQVFLHLGASSHFTQKGSAFEIGLIVMSTVRSSPVTSRNHFSLFASFELRMLSPSLISTASVPTPTHPELRHHYCGLALEWPSRAQYERLGPSGWDLVRRSRPMVACFGRVIVCPSCLSFASQRPWVEQFCTICVLSLASGHVIMKPWVFVFFW